MTRHDRDLLIAIFLILLAVFILSASALMPMRGELIESPAVFPGLMSIVLLFFGIAYAVIRNRGGKLRLGQVLHSVIPMFTSKKNRPILLGILFPGVYAFIAIPLIGFYISSALFMTVMFYAYVKRWQRWIFLPVSIGITLCLYLIFNKLFMLQIW